MDGAHYPFSRVRYIVTICNNHSQINELGIRKKNSVIQNPRIVGVECSVGARGKAAREFWDRLLTGALVEQRDIEFSIFLAKKTLQVAYFVIFYRNHFFRAKDL